MNPGTGTFISMDSYQGDLYEPVTLHKYLYANANPVKYSDPSGMFSLAESAAVNAISEVLYENRYTIMGMAILNGIGNGAMTALSGGTLSDVAKSTLEGIAKGATLGIFYCAIAAITVTSLAAVFSAVMAADAIVSIVIAVRSVMDGDYLNALIYGALAVTGIIGICRWYKVTYQVDYAGNKGIISFTEEGAKYQKASWYERKFKTEANVNDLYPNPLDEFTNPNVGPCDAAVSKYIKEICGSKRTFAPIEVQKLSSGGYEIVNGHHRWMAAQKVGLDNVPIKISNYHN